MDIQDYIDWNVIGANHEEVPDTVWSEMYNVARATFDAYHKSLGEYIFSGCAFGANYNNPIQLKKIDDFLDKINNKTILYTIKRNIFFNSLIPTAEKLTTVTPTNVKIFSSMEVLRDYNVGTIGLLTSTISIDIDYTNVHAEYKTEYYNEYMIAYKEVHLLLREALTLINGATASQMATVPNPLNDNCTI